MNQIRTLDELDELLDQIEILHNDDAMRTNLAEMNFTEDLFAGFPERLKTLDPFSTDYDNEVKKFIQYLQGHEYNISNEVLPIDVEFIYHVGIPYNTRSPSTVGNYLMAYGYIIRAMNLPVPSKILDIGCGPGGLAIHLAKMGYEMTCVDVNPQFLEVIRRTTEYLPNNVALICSDMNSLNLEDKFDAILFMESFHHSLTHRETVDKVKGFLKQGGRIFFAAEPVTEESLPAIPYPWGPRLDGESIRAMRKFGWIELGFEKKYFYQMLLNKGFKATRKKSSETWWGDVIIADPLLVVHTGYCIKFSKDSKGVDALISGWSVPEEFGTWTVGKEATVAFLLDNSFNKYMVRMQLQYLVFLSSGSNSQKLTIEVGGIVAATWSIKGYNSEWQTRELLIDIKHLCRSDSLLEIKIFIDSPISPKELGISQDDRKLGIAMKSIEIY